MGITVELEAKWKGRYRPVATMNNAKFLVPKMGNIGLSGVIVESKQCTFPTNESVRQLNQQFSASSDHDVRFILMERAKYQTMAVIHSYEITKNIKGGGAKGKLRLEFTGRINNIPL